MLLGRWGVSLRTNLRTPAGGGASVVETRVAAADEDAAGFRAGVRRDDILRTVADVDVKMLDAVRAASLATARLGTRSLAF